MDYKNKERRQSLDKKRLSKSIPKVEFIIDQKAKDNNKNNNDSSKLSNEFFDILENQLDPELYTSHNGDETMQT